MRRGADLLAVGTLLLCSLAAGWPVLSGSIASYLDNPPHLAEAYELGHGARSGWSDLAFCGFPIDNIQSPFWYGLLGAWSRAGAPLVPLYSFFLWVGFVLPSLALYSVARRRMGRSRALLRKNQAN